MTDYNSMKADEYAQRQGEMDEFDDSVEDAEIECYLELPSCLGITAEPWIMGAEAHWMM